MFLERDGHLYHAIRMQDRYDHEGQAEEVFDDMATYTRHRSVHSSGLLQGPLFKALESRDGVVELHSIKANENEIKLCLKTRCMLDEKVILYSTAVDFEPVPKV
jgi:hypothetical protein